MKLVAQWTKRLGGELGPLYERMFTWSTEDWLCDSLMIDDPGADARVPKGTQKKLGIHVIGRTGAGVFGVEQASTVFPVQDRPIFFAPFGSTKAERLSDDLASFLRDHASLRDARPRLATAVSEVVGVGRRKPGPVEARSGKAAPVKRTVTELRQSAQQTASRALGALGPAVKLVFDVDDVAFDARKKTLSVSVNAQLPPTAEAAALQHSFVRKMIDRVKEEVAEDTGIVPTVQLTFDPIDEDPIAHLRPLVAKCKEPDEVLELFAALSGTRAKRR